MKTNSWLIVAGVLLSFLLGAYISKIVGDKKLDRLKFVGDSVAVVAQQRDSAAHRFSDSIEVVVATLEKTQRALLVTARENRKVDAQLDTALIAATTMVDSNRILIKQVINLRQETLTLAQAVANANAQRDAETIRGDDLLVQLNAANRDIINLNNQIHGLHPRLPKLARYAIEAGKIGGIAYLAYQAGRNSK